MAVNINDKVVLLRIRGKNDHIVAVPSKSAVINDKAVLLPIGSKRSALANVPSIVNINDKVVLLKVGGNKNNIVAISDNTEGELIDACYYTTAIDMGFMEDDYHTWALLRSNKAYLEMVGDGCRVIRSKAKTSYPISSDYPNNPLSWTSEQAMLYEELGDIITEKVEGLLPNSYYGLSTWGVKNNRYSIDKTTNFFGTPRYCENVNNGFCKALSGSWYYGLTECYYVMGFDLLSDSTYYIGSIGYLFEGNYTIETLPAKPCFIDSGSYQFSNLKLGQIEDGEFVIDTNGYPKEYVADPARLTFLITKANYLYYNNHFNLTCSRFENIDATPDPADSSVIPLNTTCTMVVWHIYEGINGNWVFSRTPYVDTIRIDTPLGYYSTVLYDLTEFDWLWQPAGTTCTLTPYYLGVKYKDWNDVETNAYGLAVNVTANENIDGLPFDVTFRVSCVTPISFLPIYRISYGYYFEQVLVDGNETVSVYEDLMPTPSLLNLAPDLPENTIIARGYYDPVPPETEPYIDFHLHVTEAVAGTTYRVIIYGIRIEPYTDYH